MIIVFIKKLNIFSLKYQKNIKPYMFMNIKIWSYNIWFDDLCKFKRIESLINKIKIEDPCVLCFQEITDFTKNELKNKLNDKYKYQYPTELKYKYGTMIFSKFPIKKSESFKFESNMERYLDMAWIKLQDEKYIIVSNSHFESEFNEHNELKILQYNCTGSILNKIFNDYKNDENFMGLFLCADTNLTQNEKTDFDKAFLNFSDAWNNDVTQEYTYDTKTNVYLLDSSLDIQSRLDRILYKSNGIKYKSFNMIKGNLFEISDHYGISATFET